MATNRQILSDMELFQGLGREEIGAIAAIMRPQQVKEGEILTKVGDPAHTFYVILSGNYMVHFPDGHAFTLHRPGDFIGWAILVASVRYNGTSVALTDGEVLAMKKADFMRLLQRDLAMGDKIMKTVTTQQNHLRYDFCFK